LGVHCINNSLVGTKERACLSRGAISRRDDGLALTTETTPHHDFRSHKADGKSTYGTPDGIGIAHDDVVVVLGCLIACCLFLSCRRKVCLLGRRRGRGEGEGGEISYVVTRKEADKNARATRKE